MSRDDTRVKGAKEHKETTNRTERKDEYRTNVFE